MNGADSDARTGALFRLPKSNVERNRLFQQRREASAPGFQRAKRITAPDTEYTAHFAYNYNQRDKLANRFRIELNSPRFGLDGLTAIHSVLGSLPPNGFRHFVAEGRITRIDIALARFFHEG